MAANMVIQKALTVLREECFSRKKFTELEIQLALRITRWYRRGPISRIMGEASPDKVRPMKAPMKAGIA